MRWRRAGWKRATNAKTRVFQSEQAATAFINEKLIGRRDLSPVELVELSSRDVGSWFVRKTRRTPR